MASENLINDLFELIQLNTKEPFSYDDFEKDLLKNLNLPNDEIDRALVIMRTQAEINPNILGETKGGKFLFSPKFSATVVSTIKYENQFIPGKVEYDARVIGEKINSDIAIGAIILTPSLLDKMIENYGELSNEDIDKLWDEYPDMDSNQKRALREAREKKLEEIINDEGTAEEVKEMASDMNALSQTSGDISDSMDDKSETGFYTAIETFKNLRESDPEKFAEKFPDLVNVDLDTVSYEKIKYEWGRYESLCAKIGDKALDEKQQRIVSTAREDFKALMLQKPELIKKYFPMLDNQNIDTISDEEIIKAITILKELQEKAKEGLFHEIAVGTGTTKKSGEIESFDIDHTNNNLDVSAEMGNTFYWLREGYEKALLNKDTKDKLMKELVDNAVSKFESTQRMQDVMRYISEYLTDFDTNVDLASPTTIVEKLSRTLPENLGVTTEDLQALFMGAHQKALLALLKSDPTGMLDVFREPQKYYDFTQLLRPRESQNLTDQEFAPIMEKKSEDMVVNTEDLMQAMGIFGSSIGQEETIIATTSSYRSINNGNDDSLRSQFEEGMVSSLEENGYVDVQIAEKKVVDPYGKMKNSKNQIFNSEKIDKSLKKIVRDVPMSSVQSEVLDILKITQATREIEEEQIQE